MNRKNTEALLFVGLLLAMLVLKGVAELTGTMYYVRPLGFALTALAALAFIALLKKGMDEEKNEKKTPREKYLEQLETQRKAGLVDRQEYELLRARYLSMENPKDDE